jgi:hypothetical protein
MVPDLGAYPIPFLGTYPRPLLFSKPLLSIIVHHVHRKELERKRYKVTKNDNAEELQASTYSECQLAIIHQNIRVVRSAAVGKTFPSSSCAFPVPLS